MPVRKTKPTTSAQRQMTYVIGSLDKGKSVKSLTHGIKRGSGRNHAGQTVVYHKGGGAKRNYRIIDFSLNAHLDEKITVNGIQYDPNRSANIALVEFENGEMGHMLAVDGLKSGNVVVCAEKAPAKLGNRMKIKNIPVSTQISGIELTPGKGAQLCRSAGVFATLLGIDEKYAIIRMPSGESRKVLADNYATVGIVSNIDHSKTVLGKAGRVRHMGIKPTVLGKSKNPVDHPHGGGEGHTSVGIKQGPKTPWGTLALGRRTRNKKKISSRLILNRRKK
ncbi:MAG TPA: 50S ribosomal protein L2 [bacterium]|nr:50S ribosomal protein L2 [bacterium]